MLSLRDLGPRERAGQLLWIGFDGTAASPTLLRFMRGIQPGGIILFGRNIENARQVRALNDAFHRELRVPPFIALDQEGGRVNRLRSILGPSPAPLSLASGPKATIMLQRQAEATAIALRNLGFDVNFAPVLDLSDARRPNGIGDRALGDDPDRVISLARVMLRAYLQANVLPVGKHFPGLGAARSDTHENLPSIDRARAPLWSSDLLPYRRLGARLPMVMVGHAYYPALQGSDRAPATLSRRILHDLLRRRIGYRGYVLTDDLEMGAIDSTLDGGTLAVTSFMAGSDGLMFCRSRERIEEAHAALTQAIESGLITPSRARVSLVRMLSLKKRYPGRIGRRRYSEASLARARRSLASLGPASAEGFDPTARA